MVPKFVTRKERKNANSRAIKIVHDLQKELSPEYRMNPRLVGSGRYNAMKKA